MKPDDSDYEAIHKNSGQDLLSLAVDIENENISTTQILEYIAKRTDVAFRRGCWRANMITPVRPPRTPVSR